MKKLHLICNSHIDPVWMWDWEEGLGAAISTFYQAAEFFKEYEYVFCHNEAILYEFIEEHDPALFTEISRLVAEGKWHIMGGWYLQPDCNLPSGEAFVRQIKLGRAYFDEKFGARPTTAINFDSFGHNVGMVQIMKKCGYDSYLFCRPMPNMLDLPDNVFYWVGKDGSKIKAHRFDDDSIYCSSFGHSLDDIKRKISKQPNAEVGVALWGVGNHGGNPSRKDFADIGAWEEEIKGEMEIVHSTPESYFAEVQPTAEWAKSLIPCLIGAYTSMSSIKRKHVEFENALFTTEKLCAVAELRGLYHKNTSAFVAAEKALSALEFHDVGSGTCAADGEKSSLRKADCALDLLKVEYNKAFFAMIGKEKKAGEGEFPFFVFNPQPYAREAVVEMEYLMPDPLGGIVDQYTVTVKCGGEVVPSQCIKELSNINYDRRKRIAVKCTLPAMDILRLDLTVKAEDKAPEIEQPTGDILFKDNCKTVRISRKTGLMESDDLNGKELLTGGAFEPIIYDDNADPWGWDLERIGENGAPMSLSNCKNGPFRGMENVKIVEDGDVLTEVESFFEGASSFVRVSYKIYKNLPYTDVTVDVLWNEKEKALKVKVPSTSNGAFVGQVSFGVEEHEKDGRENPVQRFAAMVEGEKSFVVYNDGAFGFSHEDGATYTTLLRGVAYCAHPIGTLPLIKRNIYIPYVEQGKRIFRFRMSYDDTKTLENNAQAFNNAQLGLNFFPHGEGRNVESVLTVENEAVSLAAFYQEKGKYILRLVNNNDSAQTTKLVLQGKTFNAAFGKYEVKTFVYDGKSLIEKEIWY